MYNGFGHNRYMVNGIQCNKGRMIAPEVLKNGVMVVTHAVHREHDGGPPAQFTTESVQVKGGEDGVQDAPTTMPPPGRSSPTQFLPSWQVPKLKVIVVQPADTVNRSDGDGPPQHEQLEQMPRFEEIVDEPVNSYQHLPAGRDH